MGYAVYEDRDCNRWAGYGVPAECDMSGCEAKIDRGLAYLCENPLDDCGEAASGGMFFCWEHIHSDHEDVSPKPDSTNWIAHILTDRSWAEWRGENPGRVSYMLATNPHWLGEVSDA